MDLQSMIRFTILPVLTARVTLITGLDIHRTIDCLKVRGSTLEPLMLMKTLGQVVVCGNAIPDGRETLRGRQIFVGYLIFVRAGVSTLITCS
jgi:hypothetical protein